MTRPRPADEGPTLTSVLLAGSLLSIVAGPIACSPGPLLLDARAHDARVDDAGVDADADLDADVDLRIDADARDAELDDADQDDDSSCARYTCASLRLACGTIGDGCGGTLDCGPCPSTPTIEVLEVVTSEAATPDDFPGAAGNYWGGHQPRIVRTSLGDVCTAYIVAGTAVDASRWRIDCRTSSGWANVAEGMAGREPVHLLRGADDTLYLIAWPSLPRLWTSSGWGLFLTFSESEIPGSWETHVGSSTPYMGTGISPRGDLCLFASGGEAPGTFLFACRMTGTVDWLFQSTSIDYRHCYTFVYPRDDGGLTWIASRDVQWSTIGYTQPADAFGYVFNAVTMWTGTIAPGGIYGALIREQPQTTPGEFVMAYQRDSYVDTRGRTHVLYSLARGSSYEMRHAVISGGSVIEDVNIVPSIPTGATDGYFRLLEDGAGRLYWLYGNGSDVFVYPAANENGTLLEDGIPLNLGGYGVTYSGIHIAAPRGGTPVSDVVDAAFPSGTNGNMWVYFRLRLR